MSEHDGEIRASGQEREAVVARLNTAVGEGRLTLAEFGDRVTGAYSAQTRGDLDRLRDDLPAQPAAAPIERSGGGRTDWHVSPVGGVSRGGRWRIAERTVSVTLLGGTRLDLRDAELSAPEVTITAVSIIGGANISVPPGMRVQISGISLLGGRSVDIADTDSPNAPTLRLRIFSVIGGVTVRSTTPIERLRRKLGK